MDVYEVYGASGDLTVLNCLVVNGATSLNGAATLGDEAIDAVTILVGSRHSRICHNESERRRQSR